MKILPKLLTVPHLTVGVGWTAAGNGCFWREYGHRVRSFSGKQNGKAPLQNTLKRLCHLLKPLARLMLGRAVTSNLSGAKIHNLI